VRDKKFWLFVIGVLFVLSGFYIGKSSSEKQAVLESEGILPTDEGSTPKKEKILVTRVLDGDTVEISSRERIRYLGINAPEKGQPFSSESTALNKLLVLGKTVRLEFDFQTKDRYGRTLTYVFVGNTFVNLEMVKNGLAVSETIQPNVNPFDKLRVNTEQSRSIKYQDEIVEAQKVARKMCLGIWKGLCNKEEKGVLGEESKSCIIISSINADAKGNDNQNKNGEWIEIKNTCSELASLDKWLLKDSSASNKYQFSNVKLEGGKDINIYSGCGEDSSDKLYWQCPEGKYAIWNNTGDNAFLYNEKGELVSDYQY